MSKLSSSLLLQQQQQVKRADKNASYAKIGEIMNTEYPNYQTIDANIFFDQVEILFIDKDRCLRFIIFEKKVTINEVCDFVSDDTFELKEHKPETYPEWDWISKDPLVQKAFEKRKFNELIEKGKREMNVKPI